MKNLFKAAVFVAGSVAMVSSASALVSSHTAAVEIVTPLAVTQTTAFDFGRIVKGAATTTETISLNGSTSVSTASGAALILDSPTPGGYTITGSANDVVSISVTPTIPVIGLTLSFPAATALAYDGGVIASGASGLTAPGLGMPLKVGGDLAIAADTVASAVHNLGFDITVTYD